MDVVFASDPTYRRFRANQALHKAVIKRFSKVKSPSFQNAV